MITTLALLEALQGFVKGVKSTSVNYTVDRINIARDIILRISQPRGVPFLLGETGFMDHLENSLQPLTIAH